MRRIILFMNTSLDGVIGGADEENDKTEVQDSSKTPSQDEHSYANQLFESADTIIFGRTTYEGFTEYWDNVDISDASKPDVEIEFAKVFQRKNRVVFSRTLKQVPTNTLIIGNDITNQVNQLKRQEGRDMLLVCGSELLSTLIELNLVDEIQLIISPKIYGKGHYLFGKLTQPINLTLLKSTEFKSGGILNHFKINKT
jgi:dihydrofolate reductase